MAGEHTAEDRLRDYFDSHASTCGLKSAQGPLEDRGKGSKKRKAATAGAYFFRAPGDPIAHGATPPEDRWWDGQDSDPRHVDAPSRARTVRKHAQTHRALVALPPSLLVERRPEDGGVFRINPRDWLLAGYGSPPWPGPAPDTRDEDVAKGEAFSKRKSQWSRAVPPEVRKALGDQAGRVALLTAELAAAHGQDPRAGSPPRTLTALCQADGEPLKPITLAATLGLRAALRAFCGALGVELGEAVEVPEVGAGPGPRKRREFVWRRERQDWANDYIAPVRVA